MTEFSSSRKTQKLTDDARRAMTGRLRYFTRREEAEIVVDSVNVNVTRS